MMPMPAPYESYPGQTFPVFDPWRKSKRPVFAPPDLEKDPSGPGEIPALDKSGGYVAAARDGSRPGKEWTVRF